MKFLKFLSTISHELYYSTLQYVAKPVLSVYKYCTETIMAVYKRGGFNITGIQCNHEVFKVMDLFLAKKDPPIKINYTTA